MKPNFVECISVLHMEYINYHRSEMNNITPNYSSDFWYVIDHLDNDKLFEFTEKLLKIKKTQGKTYIKLCNINNDYRQFKKITTKQKRYLAITLITHWDDISLYFLY